MHPRADAGTRRLLAGDGPVSDVERTAQEATGSDPLPDYVHALMQQDQAEILSLRAALDEANTDRAELRTELVRWQQIAQSHNESADHYAEEIVYAHVERDRAVAQVERVQALCDENEPAPRYASFEMTLRVSQVRAALAGEGSEQLPAKPDRAEATLRKTCAQCSACTCVLGGRP
jgi:hypothetical protein